MTDIDYPIDTVERLESDLSRMKDVIAAITSENLELKKRSWIRGSRQASGGTSAAGARRSETDQTAKWLADQADVAGAGRFSQQLLSVAARGGVVA